MDTEHTRKAREATDNAVLSALRQAGESGMTADELAPAAAIAPRTVTKAVLRLIIAGLVRRDSERGRVYALPVREDGSPVTAEDIAAEAAAQHARFLAQRDSDVAKVEATARIDLRKLDPRLRHIATGRNTYLLRFAETLRQCTTQAAYDAATRAFDDGFTEIEAKFSQAQSELEQEKAQQKALTERAERQKQWNRDNQIATTPRKALPPGPTARLTKTPKRVTRQKKPRIGDQVTIAFGQQLFPTPTPPNAPKCEYCGPYKHLSPSSMHYYVTGPQFGNNGKGLCWHCADSEMRTPGTTIWHLLWD